MLLTSYKNILPASIALIGGMIFTVGLPQLLLENNHVGYTPPERREPKTTQGGGSRFFEKHNVSLQPAVPQASTLQLFI